MFSKELQEKLVRIANEEAEKAILRGDDPFGGVIADSSGNIIVQGGNREFTEMNPTSHAETVLIREACKKLGVHSLAGYISVCNAESCPMCASALLMAGIKEFYYGTHMEDFCNPYLRMADVAAAADGDIVIVDGILDELCTETVRRGRRIQKERNKY